MLEPHDHKLWTDFKHLQMQIETTIICPTGAGCNFIAGLLANGWNKGPTDSNDWLAGIPWLLLDEQSLYTKDQQVHNRIDLDRLYTRAQGMLSQDQHWGSRQAAIGHEPPYITSNVFDFHTTELISITVAEPDCWIPKLLETYKNKLITDYEHKTAYLLELLNRNDYAGWLDNVEYCNVLESMPSDTCNLYLQGTPLSIYYFCDCKANNRDPHDPVNFENFIAKEINFQDYHRYFNCDYLNFTREWCGSKASLYTKVDFKDLFFGLILPDQGALSKADSRKIAEYSENNLEILQAACNLFPVAQRSALLSDVNDLRQQLAIASLRSR
jgi:hypothetical protein